MLKQGRSYVFLTGIVLLVRIVTAIPIERAGYMDASYTLHVAERLAEGRGFTEEVLWNYLDSPTGLPHPSNLYWMPLPAILAAASFLIFGVSYHSAQVPFVLLSIIPPGFAFYLANRLFATDRSANDRRFASYAWTAGLLTLFSGFYMVYWIAPDNFAPFAVTTDSSLLLMGFALGRRGRSWLLWLVAGLLAGLSQLARADGFLVISIVPLVLYQSTRSFGQTALHSFAATVGFLIPLTPWLFRNYIVAGSLFAPGGVRTLFLTGYNELFRYATGDLTLSRYLDWGIVNIISSKLYALGFDALVVVLGGLLVFLAPFAVVGCWQLKRRAEFKPFLAYMLILLIAMPFLFTFPGMRGSMLHSSVALVPFLAVAVPPGLDSVIAWVAHRRRKWDESAAGQFFRVGFVGLACALSIFLYSQGVFGIVSTGTTSVLLWNARDVEYPAIGEQLTAWGVSTQQPVMTVDPPSFFNETHRRSIYLPTDGIEAIFQASRQFESRYLVLEYDHPVPLNALYSGTSQISGLALVARFQDAIGRPVVLYQIGDR